MIKATKHLHYIYGLLGCLYIWWFINHSLSPQLAWVEQQHYLAFDWETFVQTSSTIGGFCHWLSLLAIQFFPQSGIGSFVFAFTLLLIWPSWIIICEREQKTPLWGSLAFIIIALILHASTDVQLHFWFAVSISFSFLLLALSTLPPHKIRSYLFIVITPFAYWLCGPAALIYLLGGMILFSRKRDFWLTTLIPLLLFDILAFIGDNRGWVDSLASAFTPSFYYNPYIEQVPDIIWVSFLAPLVLISFRWVPFSTTFWKWWKKEALTLSFYVIIFIGILSTINKCYNEKSQFLYTLSEDSFREDWDALINHATDYGNNTNELFLNYIYLAMAHQGTLTNDPLRFMPNSANSLLVMQNESFDILMMQSDIEYVIGNIASAQHKAFEALSFSIPEFMSIRPMKRLVQTNIIQGHYDVAQKYLTQIEKTLFHREWAEHYRQYLYNDEAVEKDGELGRLRQNISKHNRFIMLDGWYPEIEDILQTNPSNTIAATYIGLTFLFSKNLDLFQQFIDKYKDYPALQPLPIPFQQALLIQFQQNEELWSQYGIQESTIQQYNEFRSQYIQNRNKANVAMLLRRHFGRTMWYYYMFKQ